MGTSAVVGVVGTLVAGLLLYPRTLHLQVGKKLIAMNLSNQSDASDLLGGYRPMQASMALVPLSAQFDSLVRETWPQGRNEAFLARMRKLVKTHSWQKLCKVFDAAIAKVSPSCPEAANEHVLAMV